MKKQLIILLLLIMIVIHLYEIITNDIQKFTEIWFVLVLAFLILLIHTIQKVRNYKRDNLLNK